MRPLISSVLTRLMSSVMEGCDLYDASSPTCSKEGGGAARHAACQPADMGSDSAKVQHCRPWRYPYDYRCVPLLQAELIEGRELAVRCLAYRRNLEAGHCECVATAGGLLRL